MHPSLEISWLRFRPRLAPFFELSCLRLPRTKLSKSARIGNRDRGQHHRIGGARLTWNILRPLRATRDPRFVSLVSKAFLPKTLHTNSSSSLTGASIFPPW